MIYQEDEQTMTEEKSEGYSCFEAELYFDPKELPVDIQLNSPEGKSSASIEVFPAQGPKGPFYIQVRCALKLEVRWKSSFEVSLRGKGKQGEGQVLFPSCPRHNNKQKKQRADFLGRLREEEGLIDAFAQEGGFVGVSGGDIQKFSRLETDNLMKACQAMEADGRIKIINFSPLHLVSSGHLEFLCEKILSQLGKYHLKHPLDLGVTAAELGLKFKIHHRVMSLALGLLDRQNKIRIWDDRISLQSFSVQLSPEEEEILSALEEITIQEEFHSVDMAELRRKFRLPESRLNRMLDLLVERKKIVQGPD